MSKIYNVNGYNSQDNSDIRLIHQYFYFGNDDLRLVNKNLRCLYGIADFLSTFASQTLFIPHYAIHLVKLKRNNVSSIS